MNVPFERTIDVSCWRRHAGADLFVTGSYGTSLIAAAPRKEGAMHVNQEIYSQHEPWNAGRIIGAKHPLIRC